MRRLLFSILSLGVVAIVAIGVTRAYFTDQEVLGNTIETAKVNVNLTGPGVTYIPVNVGGHLTGGLLPGQTIGEYTMTVYNRGHGQSTVPVKYAWSAAYTGGSQELFDKLEVKVRKGNCDWFTAGWFTEPQGIVTNPAGDYFIPLNTLTLLPTESNLGVNITNCTWFWFRLPTNAGNSYQGLNTQFNLVLDATQIDNPGWSE